jgi:hypothetical protein
LTDQEMRMCPGCGRQISAAYNVCPYCGRPANAPPQYGPQPAYGPQPYGPQPYPQPPAEKLGAALTIILYLVSFFIPLIGLIIGVIWAGVGSDPEKKHVGKNCLILGILGIVFYVVVGLIVALAIGIAFM